MAKGRSIKKKNSGGGQREEGRKNETLSSMKGDGRRRERASGGHANVLLISDRSIGGDAYAK